MGYPKCYDCKFRRDIPGNAHSACANRDANVKGHEHGIRKGWFFWPFNFDPVWVIECDGVQRKEESA